MHEETYISTPPVWYRKVDWLTLAFWGTVILAFCLRFYDLAAKPFHHDESLYSVYCWRFFKGEGYTYDPMMHGPFMFHFQLLVFFLLGVSDFSARVAPALFGTLLIASTYYLKDVIGKIGVLAVAILFTFSPTHLYFSRFMREDSYMACFTYMTAIFALRYYRTCQKRYFYFAAAFLALMFCEKENSYIHVFIFITFLFIKDVFQTYIFKSAVAMNWKIWVGWIASAAITGCAMLLLVYFSKHDLPAVLVAFDTWLKTWQIFAESSLADKHAWAVWILVLTQVCIAGWMAAYWLHDAGRRAQVNSQEQEQQFPYHVLFGAGIFLWIYILLYSTFFKNPGGVADGMAKSWLYWWNQHSIQRIKGPFHYYVSFTVLYEFPVFLIAAGGVLYKLANTLEKKIIVVWTTILTGLLLVYYGAASLPAWFGFTHMELRFDLILTVYVLGIGLWATLDFLKRQETVTALFVYWSVMGFLIYSYAGEKVPWLFLHILVPVAALAGIMVNQLFTSAFWRRQRDYAFHIVKWAVIVVGIVFGLYILHSTILLNYYYPANPVETMVYTQTSTDILNMLEVIEDVKFSIGAEAAQQPIIAVQGDATWPMAWYLRDYEGWFSPGDFDSPITRPLFITDWNNREKYRELLKDYQEIRVRLREWWIPDARQGTLLNWWNYFLYRKVFNPTGSTDVLFYVKRPGS